MQSGRANHMGQFSMKISAIPGSVLSDIQHPEELAADDWRIRMREDGKAPTQLLAERLIRDGYAAMQVRSFAKGATDADLNLVLWTWGSEPPARLILVDDECRLG
ncbi:RES domain-containing protein [Paracoccus versutus]|nr:RES domain-containing protein [Paracoccus versutus]